MYSYRRQSLGLEDLLKVGIDDALQLRIGHGTIRSHNRLGHSFDHFPQYKPFDVGCSGRRIGDKRKLAVGKSSPQPGEQMRTCPIPAVPTRNRARVLKSSLTVLMSSRRASKAAWLIDSTSQKSFRVEAQMMFSPTELWTNGLSLRYLWEEFFHSTTSSHFPVVQYFSVMTSQRDFRLSLGDALRQAVGNKLDFSLTSKTPKKILKLTEIGFNLPRPAP